MNDVQTQIIFSWTDVTRHALVGRKVIVRGQHRTIVSTYPDVGGIRLDAEVEDFVSWNLSDATLVGDDILRAQ